MCLSGSSLHLKASLIWISVFLNYKSKSILRIDAYLRQVPGPYIINDRQTISHSEFLLYGDVIIEFWKIIEHKHIQTLIPICIQIFNPRGYDPFILQRTVCLVFNYYTVGNGCILYCTSCRGRIR